MEPITIKDNNKLFKTLQLLSGHDQVHTSPCGNSYWKNPEEKFTSRGENRWDIEDRICWMGKQRESRQELEINYKGCTKHPKYTTCQVLCLFGRLG